MFLAAAWMLIKLMLTLLRFSLTSEISVGIPE